MARLLFIVLIAGLVGWIAVQIVRGLSRAQIDWKGIAIAAGFVVLAFYLNHVTGIGWL